MSQNDNHPHTTHQTFNCFDLPIEVRNMVYDLLWTHKNRVAAYHGKSKSGVVAWYDRNTIPDPIGKFYPYVRERRMERTTALPPWLLTSKQMLGEGLTQFRLMANWEIWPRDHLNSQQYDCEDETEDTMLMSPKHARSLIFVRLIPSDIRKTHIEVDKAKVIDYGIDEDRRAWILNLARCLGANPAVEKVKLFVVFEPFILSHGTAENPSAVHGSLELKLRLPSAYHTLLLSCKSLQELQVVLVLYQNGFVREVKDAGFVEHLRANVEKDFGHQNFIALTARTYSAPVHGDDNRYLKEKVSLDSNPDHAETQAQEGSEQKSTS